MRLSILTTVVMLLTGMLISTAQVTQSINRSNMRFAQEPPSKSKATSAAIAAEVDTSTRYFALIDSASAAIDTRQWAVAEGFIRQALIEYPENPGNSLLLSNLATLQRYQGKLSDAVKNYSMALDMTPNAVTLLLNRAATYLEWGNVEAAIADYQRVRALDPTDVESRYNLAITHIQMNDFDAAQTCIDEMLKYRPTSLLATEALGILHKSQGHFAKAIDCFSKVLEEQPSAKLLGHRADCYLVLKRLNEAADDIRNAIDMDADDGFLYVLRAKLNKMRFAHADEQRDRQLAVDHGISPTTIDAMLGN